MATSVVFIPMEIAFPFGFLFAASASPAPLEHLSLEKEVALSGNEAVSYHQGAPKMGEGQWSHQYGGAEYRFASKGNLETFRKNPEAYLSAYGGWCAYAMLDSDKVEVDIMSLKLIERTIYLFYDVFWGDTLKRWNKKQQKIPESSLVKKTDGHRAKILAK